MLRRLEAARAAYGAAAPPHPIHGDLLGNNMLLADGRVVAILDFDRLAVRPRVYDIAYSSTALPARATPDGVRTVDSGMATWHGWPGCSAGTPRRAPLYPVVAAGLDPTRAVAETRGAAGQLPPAE